MTGCCGRHGHYWWGCERDVELVRWWKSLDVFKGRTVCEKRLWSSLKLWMGVISNQHIEGCASRKAKNWLPLMKTCIESKQLVLGYPGFLQDWGLTYLYQVKLGPRLWGLGMAPWLSTQCSALHIKIDLIVCMFSCVWSFVTPWTIAHQAPLSMGFSKQEYWSGLPFPSPGDLPNPGIEFKFFASPALAGRFFTTWATLDCNPRGSSKIVPCYIGVPQYIRQMLTSIKGEVNSNKIIVGDFNTPLTPMDRSTKQKISRKHKL